MIDVLNLVRGAVSTKDMVPVLTHFRIHEGRIQGFNGRVAIDAPIPGLKDLNVVVPAERFLRAVDACEGEPKLTIDEGKLRVSRKRFRALLSLMPAEDFPVTEPTKGKASKCPGILSVVKKLLPFVGEDASRTWVCSILLRDGYAWATTNTIIARCESGLPKEVDLALPEFVAQEMLRIGRDPGKMVVSDNSLTFHYADGSWLRGGIYQEQWPDMAKFADQLKEQVPPLPADFALLLEKLEPFVKDARFPVVLMNPDGLRTEEGDHSAEVDGAGLPDARYDLRVLKLVVINATHARFANGVGVFRNEDSGVAGVFTSLRT